VSLNFFLQYKNGSFLYHDYQKTKLYDAFFAVYSPFITMTINVTVTSYNRVLRTFNVTSKNNVHWRPFCNKNDQPEETVLTENWAEVISVRGLTKCVRILYKTTVVFKAWLWVLSPPLTEYLLINLKLVASESLNAELTVKHSQRCLVVNENAFLKR